MWIKIALDAFSVFMFYWANILYQIKIKGLPNHFLRRYVVLVFIMLPVVMCGFCFYISKIKDNVVFKNANKLKQLAFEAA